MYKWIVQQVIFLCFAFLLWRSFCFSVITCFRLLPPSFCTLLAVPFFVYFVALFLFVPAHVNALA
jgi:hypothetical protein